MKIERLVYYDKTEKHVATRKFRCSKEEQTTITSIGKTSIGEDIKIVFLEISGEMFVDEVELNGRLYESYQIFEELSINKKGEVELKLYLTETDEDFETLPYLKSIEEEFTIEELY